MLVASPNFPPAEVFLNLARQLGRKEDYETGANKNEVLPEVYAALFGLGALGQTPGFQLRSDYAIPVAASQHLLNSARTGMVVSSINLDKRIHTQEQSVAALAVLLSLNRNDGDFSTASDELRSVSKSEIEEQVKEFAGHYVAEPDFYVKGPHADDHTGNLGRFPMSPVDAAAVQLTQVVLYQIFKHQLEGKQLWNPLNSNVSCGNGLCNDEEQLQMFFEGFANSFREWRFEGANNLVLGLPLISQDSGEVLYEMKFPGIIVPAGFNYRLFTADRDKGVLE